MISGVCRVCGCTREGPCELEDDGEIFACGWMDEAQTLCSNPRCLAVIPLDELVDMFYRAKAAAAAAR